MKFKKKIQTRWHQQRLKDNFFKESKKLGYRSRSAFKLLEINKKFRILKKGQTALDIGAAPGSWSQILSKKIYLRKKSNIIIGVDLKEFKPIENIIIVKKDIYDNDFNLFLQKYFSDGIDVIISDAAPSTTGNKFGDHIKSMELCKRSFDIAINFLNKGGFLVLKIFDGKEMTELSNLIKKKFLHFNLYKPKSSKPESNEIYIIGKFFK